MADLEKSVAIIFQGVDMMGSGVDSVTKRIDGVADSVERATQPLADVTLGVLKFEAALLTTGAAVTAFAIKLAGDFDAQFREISTLIDEPTDSLGAFRQEILDYGRDSTQSLDAINQSIYNAISAGVDYADSLDVVRQAERMAIAGKSDLDGALSVLVSSLNAYGAGMDQAEHFSDLLFQTVRSGVTTLPELGGSLANVTGLAATAGVSFEELLAAVATLTATGSTTSGAITQIQNAISNILKPTEQAKSLAEDLSIEFNAAALESKGLSGVLLDVQQATGGNTEQMAQLFGSVQALNGMLTLTGLGADRFADNIEAMGNATGATEEAYSRMAGTVEQGNQRIANSIQTALIAVGDPLLDEFGGIQEAIAAIFSAIGASVAGGELEAFVTELEAMFGSIEQTLLEVAKNLPEALEQADFSAFFNGIDLVRQAISDLFNGADLTSAEGLASVIETIGLGFEALSAYTAGAITAIGPFLDQLGDLVQLLLEVDPATVALVGSLGGAALAINTLAGAVTTVTGLMSAFAGRGGVVAKAVPILGGLVSVMTGPVGLAIAAGLVGKAVYDAGASFLGFSDNADEATRELREQNRAIDEGRLVYDYAIQDWVKAGEAQEDLAEWTRRTRQEVDDAIAGVDRHAEARAREARELAALNAEYMDYDALVDQAWRSSESFAREQENTAQSLRAVFDEIGPLENAWQRVDDGVFQHASNIGELETAYAQVKAAFEEGLIDQSQFDELTDYYREMVNGAEKGKTAQEELAKEVLETEEAILAAREAVLAHELALEELASNERIKSMEFSASIAVAELESDARKVEAILSATSETITGLADSAAGMWSTLAGGDLSFNQQWDLERAIEQQLDIQREAADQQRKLIDAQVDNLRARTEAMRRGDGLITISSDGLEPALEMIMWEIIEKVQLRANAEGAEFLLGLGA
ncbi:phage tail tape measure protein [Billgrantia bachuensis]|uniref:Phage tail tape measure protein n=1 Tax=Billgrantia bachuensis TaxID=2717286 RepID=A0ABX0PPR2_9GAMM|nr:phage tail tape measure protein [Halomonas bachuensis]NIC05270.1 phage tail tape measure protein [Halomonas bachuensis]